MRLLILQPPWSSCAAVVFGDGSQPPRLCALEIKLQSKLNDAWVVGIHGMQERVTGHAVDAPAPGRGIAGRSAAITPYDVISRVAGMRWIVDSELRVVENIEGLGAEFEIALAEDLEMFQEGHVEIDAAGIVGGVAAAIAERQATRSHLHAAILTEGSKGTGAGWNRANAAVHIADAVGVRAGTKIIRDAPVVRNAGAAGTAAVDNAEGCSGLIDGDAGPLPAPQ